MENYLMPTREAKSFQSLLINSTVAVIFGSASSYYANRNNTSFSTYVKFAAACSISRLVVTKALELIRRDPEHCMNSIVNYVWKPIDALWILEEKICRLVSIKSQNEINKKIWYSEDDSGNWAEAMEKDKIKTWTLAKSHTLYANSLRWSEYVKTVLFSSIPICALAGTFYLVDRCIADQVGFNKDYLQFMILTTVMNIVMPLLKPYEIARNSPEFEDS